MNNTFNDMVRRLPSKTNTGLIGINNEIIGEDGLVLKNNFANISENIKEEESRRKSYNDSVKIIDERYNKGITVFGNNILVRVFVKDEIITESGLIVDIKSKIKAQTKSGVGYKEVENPYQFTNKAIVVNMPEGNNWLNINVGDMIQLHPAALIVNLVSIDTMQYEIINEYRHWSINDTMIKEYSEHFGYMLINPQYIICKINET